MRRRILLAAGVALVLGLAVNAWWAAAGLDELRRSTTGMMTRSIGDATREYLSNFIAETSAAVGGELAAAEADVSVIAATARTLIAARPLGKQPTTWPGNELARSAEGYLQNDEGPWPVLTVWSYLQDAKGRPRPEVVDAMARTAPMDAFLAGLAREGRSRAQQLYVVGGRGREYVRLAPWADIAGVSEKVYPGANRTPFWDRFFPGLVESWERGGVRDVTYTAPYDDAAGGGLILTVFRPIWIDDDLAAVAGVDLALSRVVKRISDIRLARSGFAFLVQESGNVVAANAEAIATLRLGSSTLKASGVNVLSRSLESSAEPAIVALARRLGASGGGDVAYEEIQVGGAPWLLALRHLRSIPVWSDATGIKADSWTLGFLVPKAEVYAGLSRAGDAAREAGQRIVVGQIALAVVTLLLVVLAITVVVRRMTAPLTALARGAAELGRRSYDVAVPVPRDEELGELARAFNDMAAKVRDRTLGLEALVAERTDALHRSLESLWGEMSLAHKIQTVLLPGETGGLATCDVAATMKTAETVGGDYYDYFRSGGHDWVLVGDVSDHGVSAGLIMMMAQTAVRTAVTTADGALGPAQLLSSVNAAIRANIEKIGLHQYMTVCALRIDGARKVTYAGLHLDLLVWRAARREVEKIATHGVWLGLVDDIREHVPEAELSLAADDVLLLYTDGLTEAEVGGAMFGGDAVARLFQETMATPRATAREVVDAILAGMPVQRYDDDVTVVVVRPKAG